MFQSDLLDVIRAAPNEGSGPVPEGRTGDYLVDGDRVVSESGRSFEMRGGYLDLLGQNSTVGDNIANFTNYLPGAGAGYEPLWRVRSLSLLTGEKFSNEREMEIVFDLAGLGASGGVFLDLGCSSGLYTRNAARRLGDSGAVIGLDIAPSMLRAAVGKSGGSGASYLRADAGRLPFADGVFDGALCGGSMNEFGDPARVLRETARTLKPGGRIAIMGILGAATTNGRRLQRLLSTGGIRFFTVEEVVSILSHAGFEPDRPVRFGPVFFAGATRAA